MFFWSPEAPGPLSDCRSRGEDSDGVVKSSGNLQNFKMVTKQCPKSTKNTFQTSISYFFIVFWAPEAPGPLSDCRSRGEDLDGVVKSSGNPQNFKMVPKQSTKTVTRQFRCGGGQFHFSLYFFRLGGPGVSKKIKYRLPDSGCGGVPAPFFFGDLP